jgi:hypothetical protein
MGKANWLLLGGVLMLAVACASTPAAAPSVNVTGSWVGSWSYENPGMGTGDVRGTFQQDGEKLSGHFDLTGPVVNRVANVTGTVSGNEIKLSLPATGTMTVSGDQITGTINGLNVARITLKKQ